MDNIVTAKKAISALNVSTGVKWTNWHGKHSVIKRCVVTLTPTTSLNMNSSQHYFMPLGKAPMTDPEMFVKMYLKPRGNTMMFLPKLKIDLQSQHLPGLVFFYKANSADIIITADLLGQVIVGRRGGLKTAAVSVNNLKSFDIGAELAFSDFKNSLIMNLDLKSNQLSIGYSTKNNLWETTFEIRGNTLTAKILPQQVDIPLTKYHISGQIGFKISGTINYRMLSRNTEMAILKEIKVLAARDLSTIHTLVLQLLMSKNQQPAVFPMPAAPKLLPIF